MVKRPFKDRERIFPIIRERKLLDFESSIESEVSDETVPHFDSVDDLPNSPMLKQYIENQAEYFDAPPDEIINTQPVIDYMRKLGVLEQAIEENR